MSQLSDEAVNALVDAAREGDVDGAPAPAPASRRRARTIRVVDFRRTVKFKAEHQDRLKRAADMFCRVATTRLTSELRASAELELVDVEQGMWSRVHADLNHGSTCATIAAGERPPVLLAVEGPFVLEAVDRLLGSDGRSDVVERPLTEVDKLIARRFFATMANCLASAWKEMCGEDITLQRLMAHEQAADVAAVEEPTLVLNLEARLERVSTAMVLLIPFNAISALLARMRNVAPPDPASSSAVATSLGGIGIELRAEVGSTALSAEEVLRLAPGDVIALDTPAAGGIVLYADQVPVVAARPGRNGRKRAVQVDTSLGGTTC